MKHISSSALTFASAPVRSQHGETTPVRSTVITLEIIGAKEDPDRVFPRFLNKSILLLAFVVTVFGHLKDLSGAVLSASSGTKTVFVGGLAFSQQAVHDDRDAAITYSGSWGQNQAPKRYLGTQTYSNHAGDTASFAFTGSQISFVYARQPNAGYAQVSIDGKVVTPQLDLYYGIEFGEQVATYSGLGAGAHTIIIQVLGNKDAPAMSCYVVVDAFIIGGAVSSVRDDRDSTVSYSGSWGQNSALGRYNGTQTYSDTAGSSASFIFSGTSISYIYARQFNGGYAQISIDGQMVETINEYNAVELDWQIATYSGLSDGAHTISITATGTAAAGSTDKYVIIDGFVTTPLAIISDAYNDLDSSISYQGAWAQSIDSLRYGGQQNYSNLTTSSATFGFFGSSVTYVYALEDNCGRAQVVIDGAIVDTIDEFSTVEVGLQASTYSGLRNGAHTITVSPLGTSDNNATGSYIVVDAFIGRSAPTSIMSPPAASTGSSATPNNSNSTPHSGTPNNSNSSPNSGPSTTSPSRSGWAASESSSSGLSFSGFHHGGHVDNQIPAGNVFWPKGNCITDDTAAIQSLLDSQRAITLDRPMGGCYLVSKTLVLQPGDFLFGLSANDPTPADASHGVIIRLAPGSNVPLIRTFDNAGAPGTGNEFMTIENIVFDGNGSNQTAELQQQALVDFRGTFIQTYLRHVLIINSFGVALFTGSTQLDNVWLFNNTTSTYAWINNPGTSGLGAIQADQVYVEETMKPAGSGFQDAFAAGAVNNPSAYGHAIWFNGLGNGSISQLHCESAATCLDIQDVQALTINGISGSRIGNPASSDPTDQYLIRVLNTNIDALTVNGATFDQSGTSYTGLFTQSRVLGLANGVASNDIFQTPPGKCTWPLYTWGRWDQGFSGVPYLGERPIVTNELWIQQVGSYSPNRLAIWDNTGAPSGTYAYFERNGSQLNLGFGSGWDQNETTLLQLNYYGVNSTANNVQVPGRIQTGTQSNTDMAGELVLSSSNTANYSYAGSYEVHPECTVAPQFDIGQGNRFWLTYNGASSFTLTFAGAVTGVVSYTCVGRQ